MNLQQLEAVCHITRHRYNISAAADALGRSQRSCPFLPRTSTVTSSRERVSKKYRKPNPE